MFKPVFAPTKEKTVQETKGMPLPSAVHELIQSHGQPLDMATRAFFEPRFGADFSTVRVHNNEHASQSAQFTQALAFTVGPDIVFQAGRYAPDTLDGKRLLGHELTHVVQQTITTKPLMNETGLENEASLTAIILMSGGLPRASFSRAPVGQPLFDRGTDDDHPTGKLDPEEYIKKHRGLFSLKQDQLASDLFLLAWQSADHYSFVLDVYKHLDKNDQTEVARLFFKPVGDDWLKDLALKAAGRAFITAITEYLPADDWQRTRVEAIVLAGPQAEREKERLESVEALKKKGKNIDITLYTSYKGMDTTEAILGDIARGRAKRGATNAAFPMEEFGDIGIILTEVAKQSGGATDFIREIHLMGHGGENKFGFGRAWYSGEYLHDNYKTGLHSRYMANGATIYMEGCSVAAGNAGLIFLKEVGRIFFGDKKTGYLKGNTCKVLGMGEITECNPRTLRWPNDFP